MNNAVTSRGVTGIDAHQHFWNYSPADYPWMDGPAMEALRVDRLPGELRQLQERAGFHGSVAVQARQTLEETRWLLELADASPWILGVVGWVDLRSDAVTGQLESFAGHRRFRGVRHVVQDEPDDNFMLGREFRRGIAALGHFGLTYDLLVYPRQLPAAIELVREFPNQPFVLDHLAKPCIREQTMEPWKSEIIELARFPNVTCKVSGMVTEADWTRWKPTELHPYLDVVVNAFTPSRLMIGTDWPVCTLAASYSQVVSVVDDYFSGFSQAERTALYRDTALSFYGLEDSA